MLGFELGSQAGSFNDKEQPGESQETVHLKGQCVMNVLTSVFSSINISYTLLVHTQTLCNLVLVSGLSMKICSYPKAKLPPGCISSLRSGPRRYGAGGGGGGNWRSGAR